MRVGCGKERTERMLVRFVDGRPLSALTTEFLSYCCSKLEEEGRRVLALIWDNAGWHISKETRSWIGKHNRLVSREGEGVRIRVCQLPSKSPWLNPIEPKWQHAKPQVADSERTLTKNELAQRVCDHFGCVHEPHLSIHTSQS